MRKLITKLFYKLGYQKTLRHEIDYIIVEFAPHHDSELDDTVPIENEIGVEIIRGIFRDTFITIDLNSLSNGRTDNVRYNIHSHKENVYYWGIDRLDKQVASIVSDLIALYENG